MTARLPLGVELSPPTVGRNAALAALSGSTQQQINGIDNGRVNGIVNHMTTTKIPESKLVELRARGHANLSRFVDPHAVARCSKILDRRGEEWAASVLGRDISRRSIAVPNRPYLTDGELYALNAADNGEDRIALGLAWGAGLA